MGEGVRSDARPFFIPTTHWLSVMVLTGKLNAAITASYSLSCLFS